GGAELRHASRANTEQHVDEQLRNDHHHVIVRIHRGSARPIFTGDSARLAGIITANAASTIWRTDVVIPTTPDIITAATTHSKVTTVPNTRKPFHTCGPRNAPHQLRTSPKGLPNLSS